MAGPEPSAGPWGGDQVMEPHPSGQNNTLLTFSEKEVAQSCPTLSDPMDCSLPGSSAHGIFQARVLEWVAIEMHESEK